MVSSFLFGKLFYQKQSMLVFFEDHLTLGRIRGSNGDTPPNPPHKVFLSFFLADKTSIPDVFGSWLFIPRAHVETRLVMVRWYGYEI